MKHKNLEKRLKIAFEGTVRSQLAVSQQSIFHFKFKSDFFQGLILNSDVQPQPTPRNGFGKSQILNAA